MRLAFCTRRCHCSLMSYRTWQFKKNWHVNNFENTFLEHYTTNNNSKNRNLSTLPFFYLPFFYYLSTCNPSTMPSFNNLSGNYSLPNPPNPSCPSWSYMSNTSSTYPCTNDADENSSTWGWMQGLHLYHDSNLSGRMHDVPAFVNERHKLSTVLRIRRMRVSWLLKKY